MNKVRIIDLNGKLAEHVGSNEIVAYLDTDKILNFLQIAVTPQFKNNTIVVTDMYISDTTRIIVNELWPRGNASRTIHFTVDKQITYNDIITLLPYGDTVLQYDCVNSE